LHDEKIYGTHAHHMADIQEPIASHTHNNTQNIKHHHHGPPKPPASSGSNVKGECDCRTLHDRSQSLQHGDLLFIDDTKFSFIVIGHGTGRILVPAKWHDSLKAGCWSKR
jgi:hypothetical protein